MLECPLAGKPAAPALGSGEDDSRRCTDQHFPAQFHRWILIEDDVTGGHVYVAERSLDRRIDHVGTGAAALGEERDDFPAK